ncbi:unnamed protein product [Paramecium primaurelia]|uniref:Transmembrane protein n=1 Tax=Paramecium primaurelia TaxID=5886 RepID=A0A8S1N3L1_PARPR|nr:unnamed protein product [Paramecium primaurelia]
MNQLIFANYGISTIQNQTQQYLLLIKISTISLKTLQLLNLNYKYRKQFHCYILSHNVKIQQKKNQSCIQLLEQQLELSIYQIVFLFNVVLQLFHRLHDKIKKIIMNQKTKKYYQ